MRGNNDARAIELRHLTHRYGHFTAGRRSPPAGAIRRGRWPARTQRAGKDTVVRVMTNADTAVQGGEVRLRPRLRSHTMATSHNIGLCAPTDFNDAALTGQTEVELFRGCTTARRQTVDRVDEALHAMQLIECRRLAGTYAGACAKAQLAQALVNRTC